MLATSIPISDQTQAVPPLGRTQPFRWGAIILIFTFIAIYALTIDTGLQPRELQGGDLITHQYAQVQARPSNAPGYPIYTMGGWLWFHSWHGLFDLLGNPYPNPMPLLSSYSTLWALLALWLFYSILGEVLGACQHPWQATLFCLLVAAFVGVTYFFWYYATTTEQYSSAVAQTLAIVYLYLLWDKQPARRGRLYSLAFLCGISLAHMLTVAFIVPPLVALVLWRDPSLLRRPRAIFFAILAAALPLLSYIYVYYRGALHPQWWGKGNWVTPQQWFWSFISTSQGRDELARAFEPGRPLFGNGFPNLIWQELSLPLLILGLIGIAFLRRRLAILLYVTLGIYLIFCWFYRFGNWFQVILPAYPLILIGLAPYFGWLQGNQSGYSRLGRWFAISGLTIALFWRVEQSLPAANSRQRSEDTALDHTAMLLDQSLPRNARLFAGVDDALAINYFTQIWGIRRDIKTLNSHDANDDLSDGDLVFTTVDAAPDLIAELTLTPTLDSRSPDWIKLSTRAVTTSEPSLYTTPVFTVTPDLLLSSYFVQPAPTASLLTTPITPALDVTLTWLLPTGVWPDKLAISLRPTYHGLQQAEPQSSHPIQQDRSRPVNGLWIDRPIRRSVENPVVVHDAYRLIQPATLANRADGLLLILYTQNAGGFTNVTEIPLSLPPIGS